MKKIVFSVVLLAVLAGCATVKELPPIVQTPPPPPESPYAWVWRALSDQTEPERELIRDKYRYDRGLSVTDVPDVRYFAYHPGQQDQMVGFSMTNRGSERINPAGRQRKGAMRIFTFLFPDRARENIYLTINDDVNISGRFSQDNMFRELHFFPRLQLPTIEKLGDGQVLRVTLPTGEPVLFDAATKEISGGVLNEAPMDFNRNRFARANPRIDYQGDNLMITVAQRGEAPRRAQIWGQTKFAEVNYPAKYRKPCRISPGKIWDQRPKKGDSDPTLTMLYPTDAELFKTIERQCHWDLSTLAARTDPGAGRVARN